MGGKGSVPVDDDDADSGSIADSCLVGLFFGGRKKRINGKPEDKPIDQKYFGVPLHKVFQQQELISTLENGLTCPILVVECVQYLSNVITLEGLFRVSGTWGEVNLLKASFEGGAIPDFKICENPHSIASLLDLYLRQLPDPLLTAQLYDELITVGGIQEPNERLKALKNSLKQLPEPNLHLLRYLMNFLKEITNNSDQNKMDARNLAIIFGPILMGGEENLSLLALQKIKTQSTLVELLITHYNELIPSVAAK